MNKIITLLSLSLFVSITSFAQYSVQGQVFDAQNNKPLSGASAYIGNTTKGASTDVEGKFDIDGLFNAHYDLVISFVGYEPVVIDVVAGSEEMHVIKLKPAAKVLDEVPVNAKRITKAQWNQYLRDFEEHFVGISDNARLCKIENEDAINLDKENDVLTATSDTSLILKNNGLGYRVSILLQRFEYNSKRGTVLYEGKMMYEQLKSESPKQNRLWAKNRLKAYYGSKMHFFRSLFNRRLTNEGFYISFNDTLASDTMMYVKSEPHNYNEIEIRTITDYNFIVSKPLSGKQEQTLRFNQMLNVLYGNERESYVYRSNRGMPVKPAMQWTQLTLKRPATVLPDGRVYPIEALEAGGYWSWELLSEALPLDYDPASDLSIIKSK